MSSKKTSPRVLFLRDQHAHRLHELFVVQKPAHPSGRNPTRAFHHALAMDPTVKSIYLQTIINWLLSGTMRFEDGRSVRDLLAKFDARKHGLAEDRRDIGSYASPGDLSEIVEPLGEAIVLDMPETVRSGSNLVDAGDGWSLHEVSSTEAATWWADSTRWCTRHPGTSANYLVNGPLLVLVVGKEKYQAHRATSQFTDRHDRPMEHFSEGLPIPALEALLSALDRDNPRSEFFRMELALAVLHFMDATDGGNRVKERIPTGFELAKKGPLKQELWSDASGSRLLSRVDNGPYCRFDLFTRDENGAWSHHAMDTEEAWASLEGEDSMLFCMIEAGIRRADGLEANPQFPFWFWGSARSLPELHAFLPHSAPVIRKDGRSTILISSDVDMTVPKGTCPEYFRCLDLDASPGHRVARIATVEDLAMASDRVREALRLQFADGVSMNGFEAFRRDIMLGRDSSDWTAASLKAHAIRWALDTEWFSGYVERSWFEGYVKRSRYRHQGQPRSATLVPWKSRVEEMVSLVFADTDHAAIWGMIRSLRRDSMHYQKLAISAKDGRIANAAEALLSIRHVEGAGILLAAIPDEDCSVSLIESLLEAGRLETMSVMPPRFYTDERIRTVRAIDANDWEAWGQGLALRSMSPQVLPVLERNDCRSRLAEQTFERHKEKARTALAAGLGRWARTMPFIEDALTRTNGDVVYDERKLTVILENKPLLDYVVQFFRITPTVATPWPFVLVRLRKSLDDLPEVMESLDAGGWCDDGFTRSQRMADLRSIPGTRRALKSLKESMAA